MAIRGRLDELQASEVLQFLTQSGRSGTLRFRDGSRSKFLSFDTGRLVFAVSQHALPPLAEVLHQRGRTVSHDQPSESRFDEELTKALEWSRSGSYLANAAAFRRTRIGSILIDRGSLTESELEIVLNPGNMPEPVLEDILVGSGLMTQAAIADVSKANDSDESLYYAILKSGTLTEAQIIGVIACMPEDTLAQLLVTSGYVKSNEAAYCLEQLQSLRGETRPLFRIGEYLVVCGKLTQRQLEKALGAQLTRRSMLGQILVEQGVITEEDITEAERDIAELRLEFSPLRSLREALVHDHGFTRERFAAAREEQLETEKTLAAILVETGRVAEADLRKKFEENLSMELSDLMLWQEGTYEFFEGFSLADALGDEGLDRIHGYSFEVSSLLLDAHYRVDELRRTVFRSLSPSTILTGAPPAERTEEITDGDIRLLERMDGKRTLGDVCAVLPGNLLSHSKRIARFMQLGLASPLTRKDAFDRGQEAMNANEFGQAMAFFEHATRAAGEGPEDAELRMWIQHARLAQSHHLFKRLAHTLRRGLRYLSNLRAVRGAVLWCGRHEAVAAPCRWLGSAWKTLRDRWVQASRRTALTIQDFMIQKGLARKWWTVRRHVLNPIAGWGGRPAPKVMTSIVAVLMVALALVIPGIADIEPGPGTAKSDTPENPLLAFRAPIKKLRFDAPVETAPVVTANSLFVTTRDGKLRGIPLGKGSETAEWEVELGEYGDLLSSPARFKDKLFVTNVRGAVHAVTVDGARIWTKLFPRVERIAPTLIAPSRTELVGVAIAARESLFVLEPDQGRILYRLRCGNLIEARPVADGDRVFVGSADNHVYCSDWRRRKVLWDTEVGQDVLAMVRVEDTLIVLIRGGGLVALRTRDGAILWKKTDETRRVRSICALRDGQVGLEMEEGGGEVLDAASSDQVRTIPAVQNQTSVRLLVADSSTFYYSERGDIGQIDVNGGELWECGKILRRITSLRLNRDRLVATSKDGDAWIFMLRHGDSRGERSDD